MKYDHICNSRNGCWKKRFEIEDDTITILLENEDAVLKADKKGNISLWTWDGRELTKATVAGQNEEYVDHDFGGVTLSIVDNEFTSALYKLIWIDQYPNCDGEN